MGGRSSIRSRDRRQPPSDHGAFGLFDKLSPAAQWGALLAGSIVFAALLELAGLPAALLLGPAIAGIIAGVNGASIRTPRLAVLCAQTIVGCLIARSITAEIVHTLLKDWPVFLGVVVVMLASSSLLGWVLSRLKVLPGTTAVWGVAPGGASAMILMAGEFGADPRLVAFMQYLRVVFVAGLAAVVARLWAGAPMAIPGTVLAAPIQWLDFTATVIIALAGGILGVGLKIPAGALLVPMIGGAILESTGLVAITLPSWLLAISYAILGWMVGLGFTRDLLAHASRALGVVLMTIFITIGVSAALALLLVRAAGIDPLTAYLATSPGGIDSVAIIAASSDVDISFVMALQALRVMVVLAVGPPLARFVAKRMMS